MNKCFMSDYLKNIFKKNAFTKITLNSCTLRGVSYL